MANRIIAAGEETGDRVWRMPVFKSHKVNKSFQREINLQFLVQNRSRSIG